MTVTFSGAALDRILAVCDRRPKGSTTALLDDLSEWVSNSHAPYGLPEFDDVDTELWSISAPEPTLLTVLGLIELGIIAGYVDISDIDKSRLDSVGKAIRAFAETLPSEETPASSVDPTLDLTLLERLAARLVGGDAPAIHADSQTFGAFEAYLDLMSFIWTDVSFKRFLIQTHAPRLLDHDLSFLLSAQHFASAIAIGRVGEVPTLEVAGGFAALRYFDWFRNILDGVGHASDLYDGFVRHARWSHGIETIEKRLHKWAETMAEWPAERDVSGEHAWAAYVGRVFKPLAADQSRLGVQLVIQSSDGVAGAAVDAGVEAAVKLLQTRTSELVVEGRAGAARRLAMEVIASQRREVELLRAGWDQHALDLVRSCTILANLGDNDTAAAYLAPVMLLLKERLASGMFKPTVASDYANRYSSSARDEVRTLLDRATKILAHARTGAAVEVVEEVRLSTAPPQRQSVKPTEKLKERSAGGSASASSDSEK